MITMDLAGLVLIIIVAVVIGRISANPAEFFDIDNSSKGGIKHGIKHWFQDDFFGVNGK